MRTIQTNIYRYSELADEVRAIVREQHAAVFGFDAAEEYLDSLSALANHFGGCLVTRRGDWFSEDPAFAEFAMPDLESEDLAVRLAELGTFNLETKRWHGECKLTGFASDEAAIDGFRIAYAAGERNLERLMQAAFREWLKQGRAECAASYEDSAFSETSDANEWEYCEEGRMYRAPKEATP